MERYQPAKNATIASGECSRERIESTLATILASDPFRTSPQCRDLLQHIVTHTLNLEHDLLKERVLGITVFGRKPDYDTASDPIVRVRAADVRKRLAQFYQSNAWLPGMARIDIPTGGYHAMFRILRGAQEEHIDSSLENADQTSLGHGPFLSRSEALALPSRHGHGWMIAALSSPLVLMIAAGVVWAVWLSNKHTRFEEFWAPALASSKAITIYNADSPAYRLRCHTPADKSSIPHVSGLLGTETAPCTMRDSIESSELVPVQNQFITIGDGYATALLCGLLARHDKPYQLRFGSELSFVDLRYSSAVLIGAFNNEWTLETTRDLKFVFSNYPSIRERGGQNRVWALANVGADGETAEDYAIVSRVFSSETGQVLLAAAGITQYGTRAAGEFLTSREELEGALQRAPVGWPKRNVQFVIHTQIVRETPGRPSVVASYFW